MVSLFALYALFSVIQLSRGFKKHMIWAVRINTNRRIRNWFPARACRFCPTSIVRRRQTAPTTPASNKTTRSWSTVCRRCARRRSASDRTCSRRRSGNMCVYYVHVVCVLVAHEFLDEDRKLGKNRTYAQHHKVCRYRKSASICFAFRIVKRQSYLFPCQLDFFKPLMNSDPRDHVYWK